jgi:hypothetical protein
VYPLALLEYVPDGPPESYKVPEHKVYSLLPVAGTVKVLGGTQLIFREKPALTVLLFDEN